jgi:hypothetical protein
MKPKLTSALVVLVLCGLAVGLVRARGEPPDGNRQKESDVSCVGRAYEKPLPPAGPGCTKEILARHGHPFMFPVHGGMAFGVSSDSDKPSSLNLWVDNQTDKEQTVSVCCLSTLLDAIDVFDSTGHRLLNWDEQMWLKARSDAHQNAEYRGHNGCDCSGFVRIPAHMMQIVDFGDLSRGYSLSPGKYIVSERKYFSQTNGTSAKNEMTAQAPAGLVVSIP